MPGFERDDEQTVSSPYSALSSGGSAASSNAPVSISNPMVTDSDRSSNETGSSGSSGSSDTISGGESSDTMIGKSGRSSARPAQTREEVRNAQINLAAMNLYHGRIDGLNGPKTRAATLAFQEYWNAKNPKDRIKEDGVLGWNPNGKVGVLEAGRAETRPRLELSGRMALANRSGYVGAGAAAQPKGALSQAASLPYAGRGPGRSPSGPGVIAAVPEADIPARVEPFTSAGSVVDDGTPDAALDAARAQVLSGGGKTGTPPSGALDIAKGMPAGYVPTPADITTNMDPKAGMALAGGKGVTATKPVNHAAAMEKIFEPLSAGIEDTIRLSGGNRSPQIETIALPPDPNADAGNATISTITPRIVKGAEPPPSPRPASVGVDGLSPGIQEEIARRGTGAPPLPSQSLRQAGIVQGLGDARAMTAGMEEMPGGAVPAAPVRAFTDQPVISGEELYKRSVPPPSGAMGQLRQLMGVEPGVAAEAPARTGPLPGIALFPGIKTNVGHPPPMGAKAVVPGIPAGGAAQYDAASAAENLLLGETRPKGTGQPYATGPEGQGAGVPWATEAAENPTGRFAPPAMTEAKQRVFETVYDEVAPQFMQQPPEMQARLSAGFTAIGEAADAVLKVPDGPQRIAAWDAQIDRLAAAGILSPDKAKEMRGKVDNKAIERASMMNDVIERLQRDMGGAGSPQAGGRAMPPIPRQHGVLEQAKGVQVADASGAIPAGAVPDFGIDDPERAMTPEQKARMVETYKEYFKSQHPEASAAQIEMAAKRAVNPNHLLPEAADPNAPKFWFSPRSEKWPDEPGYYTRDQIEQFMELPHSGAPKADQYIREQLENWDGSKTREIPMSSLDRARMVVASKNGFQPEETLTGSGRPMQVANRVAPTPRESQIMDYPEDQGARGYPMGMDNYELPVDPRYRRPLPGRMPPRGVGVG